MRNFFKNVWTKVKNLIDFLSNKENIEMVRSIVAVVTIVAPIFGLTIPAFVTYI